MLTILALVATLTASDSLTFSGRAGQLRVNVPRMEDVHVDIDGRLDDAVWGEAALLADFTQYEPVEGIAASEDTEVRVFYTHDAIYFGIRARDREPDKILARLGERDRAVFGDDWVRIMLDTFDDQRQAYVFYVNPLGLQTDGLWIEGLQRGFGRGGGGGGGVSIDFNPDFIWESDGRVDGEGWAAEIRIPYVSLRFREVPSQDWGIQVAREVKRRGFKQSWAPLTKEVSSTLAQSGKLVGLKDLHPKRLVEVNPVATGRRDGLVQDGAFVHHDPESDFGVNGRYGITRNLVLDATYNPDFSQVEADANRIQVNERFALFFPEKRSFFLEGAEIFSTPARLVYTRQIVDPVAGAKLSGKLGPFNVGYIGALDESPTTIRGGSGRAAFNLVRARRDIGRGSTVGLLYTDRTMTDGSGEYNRVVAGDLRYLFGGRYTVTAQVAGSVSRAGGAESNSGFKPLVHAEVARSGRSFSFNAKVQDIHPDFRARGGFITRAGDTEANASVRLTRYGSPGAVLERFTTEVRLNNFFDHDDFWHGGTPFESEVEVQPSFSLRGARTLTFIVRHGYFRFRPEDYSAYELETPLGGTAPYTVHAPLKHMWAVGFIPRIRVNNQSNVNGSVFVREIPIFSEGSRGFEVQVGPRIDLKPTTQLQLSLNHTYSRIWRTRREKVEVERPSAGVGGPSRVYTSFGRTVGTPYSTVNITRLRVQYQFNKAIFARAIIQYDLEERARLIDPTSGWPILIGGRPSPARSSGEFQGQFLAQYEPSPGTIFYAGYTRLMEGARSYSLRRMDAVEDGFFLKLSYLFRM